MQREGRTKMKLLRFTRIDLVAFGVCSCLVAAVSVLAAFGL